MLLLSLSAFCRFGSCRFRGWRGVVHLHVGVIQTVVPLFFFFFDVVFVAADELSKVGLFEGRRIGPWVVRDRSRSPTAKARSHKDEHHEGLHAGMKPRKAAGFKVHSEGATRQRREAENERVTRGSAEYIEC